MAKKKPTAPTTRRLCEVPIIGRLEERARLARAYVHGSLPRGIMLRGEEGIGKQRLAFWLAQLILCPAVSEAGPCGTCESCRQSANLAHPDLLLYFPHSSLGGGTAEQLIEKAEVERINLIEKRRDNALYEGMEPGTTYQVAMARALKAALTRSTYNSYGRRVVILAEAHLLTPRLGAEQSANALLKVLEEPPAGTYFILTSSVPERVLSTIRSRVSDVSVRPLENEDVLEILKSGLNDADPTDLAAAIEQSGGSVTQARRWMDPEWQARREQSLSILTALANRDRARAHDLVGGMQAKSARGSFAAMLSDLQHLLFMASAVASGAEEGIPIDPRLFENPTLASIQATAWSRCLKAAITARAQAEGNATPQLVLAGLVKHSMDALAA